MVGTVKGGQFWTHFKTGHGELADELEVGSGMRKRKKKPKDNVRVPRELQAETAAISWDDTAGGASLSRGEAAAGGQETKGPAWAGQVSAGCQTSWGRFYFLIIRLLLLKMMLRFNRSDIILGDNVEQSLLTKLFPFKK